MIFGIVSGRGRGGSPIVKRCARSTGGWPKAAAEIKKPTLTVVLSEES